MKEEKLTLSDLRRIPEHDEIDMLMMGQVQCPAQEGCDAYLPTDPADTQTTPNFPFSTIVDYAEAGREVLIKDHPDGLRVLQIEGEGPNNAYLFGSVFNDRPTRLVSEGLAFPAEIPATHVVMDSADLPRGQGDSCLLAKIFLCVELWLDGSYENYLGWDLGAAGIRLASREEARLTRLLAQQALRNEFPFDSTTNIFHENQRYWAERGVVG